MLTKKVRKLRETYIEEYGMENHTVKLEEIYDELIDNCKPTADEFEEIVGGLIGTSKLLYRLAMDAPDNWK